MGLIIKDKIPSFIVGYPTISDKYDVLPAVLDGTSPVKFGDLVVYSGTKGYYTKPTTITAATQIAGFVVATNVKLAEDWPGKTVQVNPGEAFNLLFKGFMAVELGSTVTIASVVAGAQVAVTATGAIVEHKSSGTFDVPNCYFSGQYENVGTDSSPKYIAEIYIR